MTDSRLTNRLGLLMCASAHAGGSTSVMIEEW